MGAPPFVDDRPDVVASFLTDAAHMPGGHAAGVAFPRTPDEVSEIVRTAARILPVGAQSSLTGGATPRGDVVLSTRGLTRLAPAAGQAVQAGAGVPLVELQRTLSARGLAFPPVPTYDGAFVGGVVATNAAGAATFKYGSTRQWVDALTLVMADGARLDLARGDVVAAPDGWLDVPWPHGSSTRVPVPTYRMPVVPKLSAGYYARPAMDLVDLFIGSEGTLAVVVEARLRVAARPARLVALVPCRSDAEALALTAALRREAAAAWRGDGPLDVAAVEYMDGRSLALVPDDAFANAGVARPDRSVAWILLQTEVRAPEEAVLARLQEVLTRLDIAGDPLVAPAADERGAARLFALREAVPSSLNMLVAAAQARSGPAIHKTAGDMVVPFDRLDAALACYRAAFERRGLDYAIWGHVSDGNLHPNVVPQSPDDVERGEEAILEIGREVIAMGGAPLAEHGVGRSPLKQRLLHELYGERGVEQMRAVKRALDPEGRLAAGVIFPP